MTWRPSESGVLGNGAVWWVRVGDNGVCVRGLAAQPMRAVVDQHRPGVAQPLSLPHRGCGLSIPVSPGAPVTRGLDTDSGQGLQEPGQPNGGPRQDRAQLGHPAYCLSGAADSERMGWPFLRKSGHISVAAIPEGLGWKRLVRRSQYLRHRVHPCLPAPAPWQSPPFKYQTRHSLRGNKSPLSQPPSSLQPQGLTVKP